MMLTTKSRYAVMAMVDLAATAEREKPMKLAEIAARQEIALNYLEQIFIRLRQAGLVKSVKGPGGGYALAAPLSQIRISDIVAAVDESVEMTRCATHGKSDPKKGCMRDNARCLTHDLWEGLTTQITDYLSSITLEDIRSKAAQKSATPDFINP